jgi:hypothetical protein
MRAPAHFNLKAEALAFWKFHAKSLADDGMLTERDVHSFATLCQVWHHLQHADPTADGKERVWYIGLLKQYQTLSKQFGLLPRDRKRSGTEPEESLDDALDKRMTT